MSSSSLPFVLLRATAWVYVGSLAAVGGVALLALCGGLFGLAVQLVMGLLQQVGA